MSIYYRTQFYLLIRFRVNTNVVLSEMIVITFFFFEKITNFIDNSIEPTFNIEKISIFFSFPSGLILESRNCNGDLRKVVALRLDIGLQAQDLGLRIGSGSGQDDGEKGGEDEDDGALHG